MRIYPHSRGVLALVAFLVAGLLAACQPSGPSFRAVLPMTGEMVYGMN